MHCKKRGQGPWLALAYVLTWTNLLLQTFRTFISKPETQLQGTHTQRCLWQGNPAWREQGNVGVKSQKTHGSICLFILYSSISKSPTPTKSPIYLEFPFVKENFGGQKWKFIYKIYMRKGGEGKEWFIIMAYISLHIQKFQGNIFFFIAWIINHHSITKGEYLDGTAAFLKNTPGRWMTGKFMDNSVAWLSCLQESSLCQYLNLSWQFTQQILYLMEWGFLDLPWLDFCYSCFGSLQNMS